MSPEESTNSESQPEEIQEDKKASRWEVYFPSRLVGDRRRIFVASFPAIIYFWPLMIVFFVCAILQNYTSIPEGTLGWVALLAFASNVLVIVQDFDQKKFLILILAIALGGLGTWLVQMYGLTFLETFVNAMINLEPTFSTSAYFIFGSIIFILMCWGLIHPMFDYWQLEHNEFVHYIQPFGRDISIPRQGSTVVKQIPDMLEFFLTFGGGSLVISRDGKVMATIPNIPFLGRRMKAIEKLLSETRVTTLD